MTDLTPVDRAPAPRDHDMAIVHDRQQRRGWYLSWRCTTKGCDASGNTTAPSRETAQMLFGLVAEGHRQSEAEQSVGP